MGIIWLRDNFFYRKRKDDKYDGNKFLHKGKWYLIRCPECGRENYATNVPTGICTWCGYDANEDKK